MFRALPFYFAVITDSLVLPPRSIDTMALATSPCSRRCPPAAMAGGGLLLAGSADPNLGGYTISMVTFLWGLPDCADPVSSTRPSGEVNPATHGRLTTTPAMRSILVNPSRASPVLLHFLSGTIAIANLPRLYARLPNMRLRCQMCPGTGRGHLAIRCTSWIRSERSDG